MLHPFQMTEKQNNRPLFASKAQIVLLLLSFLLFCLLFFVFSNKPPTAPEVTKKRALSAVVTDDKTVIQEATAQVSSNGRSELLRLETILEKAENDSVEIDALKNISSLWFNLGHPEVAGIYAEQVANIEGTSEAWGIAGTTFNLCIQQAEQDKIKRFCRDKAVLTLEKAVSLNPAEVNHKINLALTYVSLPLEQEPMKGILMLRRLNEKYPENTAVLNQLGRLALMTGQGEKAVERFNQVLELDSENLQATCMLVQAHNMVGNMQEANKWNEKCQKIRSLE